MQALIDVALAAVEGLLTVVAARIIVARRKIDLLDVVQVQVPDLVGLLVHALAEPCVLVVHQDHLVLDLVVVGHHHEEDAEDN